MASSGVDAATPGSQLGDAQLGEFDIRLVPPTEGANATDGFTSVLGKVYAAEVPDSVVWETSAQDGACRLLTPRVPFCNPACGSAVCVDDDVCKPNPASRDLGKVTVTGVKTAAGASQFDLLSVQNTYSVPGDTKLPFPAFAEGDAIEVKTSGGGLAAFSLKGRGIAPFALSDHGTYALDAKSALTLNWAAPSMKGLSTVSVKLDISHHGGTKGKIECDTEDSGSVEIAASLIGGLLDLGAAGFPTIVVQRSSLSSTRVSGGHADLKVYMFEERAVDVPGVVSCTASRDCPSGATCGKDLTCSKS